MTALYITFCLVILCILIAAIVLYRHWRSLSKKNRELDVKEFVDAVTTLLPDDVHRLPPVDQMLHESTPVHKYLQLLADKHLL